MDRGKAVAPQVAAFDGGQVKKKKKQLVVGQITNPLTQL